MSIQYAYSLCDAMEFFLKERPVIGSRTEKIYLGSYFCDRYYCSTPASVWRDCFDIIRKHSADAVLVVPTPSQQRLAEVKKRTEELMEQYSEQIHEIVVNDGAMLEWFSSQFPDQSIWLGRTMDKELRDPRYFLPGAHKKLLEQVDTGFYSQANILGVETDMTNLNTQLHSVSAFQLGIHTPFAYLSMGRICEFASIGFPPSEKFQLYRPCRRQCMSYWIWCEQDTLSFLKHGRAVYTPVTGEIPLNHDANIRIIESVLSAKVGDPVSIKKGSANESVIAR